MPHSRPICTKADMTVVQEALVLSAMLPGEPGRIVVLDEPAVNCAKPASAW